MLLLVLLFAWLAAAAYVGFVLHKKRINVKDIRVRNVNDAKELLSLPTADSSLKYLQKVA